MFQKDYYEQFDRQVNRLNLKRYMENRIKRIFSDISLENNGKILDVGCGRGFFFSLFKKNYRNCNVVGIDLSFKQCSLGKESFPGSKFVVAKAETAPFRDGEFDIVFANALLHHVSEPKKVIGEMIRICKPSGHIVIIEQNKYNLLIALLSLFKKCERNTFRLSVSKISFFLKEKVNRISIYPVNSYIYPYHSFPPNKLRNIVEKLEEILKVPILCTHYLIIAEV